ncbi:MAG: aminoglycoside 3'-phosphotransferase/choline kinase family protein [Planctomycetota bacterium]
MPLLPAVQCDDDVDHLRTDVATCVAAIAAVAAQEGLPATAASFYEDGSALVGSVGDSVIKIFAPFDEDLCNTEQRVLTTIDSRLTCPTPALERRGTFEGWPYIVMRRLDGVPLSNIWDDLPSTDKKRLCAAMGQATAELHQLSTSAIDDIPPQWESFLQQQRTSAVDRQRKHPIPEPWLAQIDPFLASVQLRESSPVLLHTELMRAHFLVEQQRGEWQLSGLVDFEPAMIGAAEYDFSSVGLFVTSGEPGLLRTFLQAYGYGDKDLDEQLQYRALAYTLLHRYSCLAWYFRFMPMEGLDTLEQLATRWWCF